MFASGNGFSAYHLALCVQQPPSNVISRSNFHLSNLDTSPRQSRVFVPDFPSPSGGFEQQQSLFNCSLPNQPSNYANQTILGTRARLMNSNDSLNNDNMSQNYRPNNSQQLADPNDLPRNFVPPVLSSPAVSRREFIPQNGYISVPPPAQHGKMLIDPQTGQQYFVATNSQPQQVAYYPVFYNTAAPPPPIQQHVYYTHPAHPPQPQWISGPMPSPPVSNAHQPNFFAPHYQQQPSHYPATTSTAGYAPAYHVEVPPSSSVSVVDDRANSPNSVYFQRHHESRMSTESGTSGNHQFQPQQFNSDDSMSPIPPRTIPRNASSSSTGPSTSVPTVSQTNPLMEHSARYSTTSSTTSGFVSGAGESTADVSLNRPNNLRTTFNKPKLYGAPEWWGEESSPEIDSGKKKIENDRTPTQTNESLPKKLDSPTTQKTKTVVEVLEKNDGEPKIVAKSIRMDIDLSRPLSPVHKKAASTDQKASNRAAPTSFTVNFGDDENNSARRGKPPVLSSSQQQQDGSNNRRSNRRSAPPNRPQLPKSNSSQLDPKHYLFSKMIQGFPSASSETTDDDDQHTTILSLGGGRNDIDAISECGTYTIQDENKYRRNNQSQRQYSDVSSTSSASSSTATNKSVTESQPPSTARTNNTVINDGASSARSTATSNTSPHFAMRRSLMKDLADLRKQQQLQQQQKAAAQQPKARTMAVDPLKSSRLGSNNQKSVMPQPTPIQRPGSSSTSSAGFRRSDGGRFSMRTGGGAPAVPNTKASNKPPFKAGIAPPNRKGQVASGTPEMTNWLRRKGYDPRKSVDEAKKIQKLKERSDTFFANRSVSYNQPYCSGFRKLLKPIDDERSNISQSQDDLSRLKEEVEDFSISGSNSDLTKTVNELSLKCQRSIQLLKLCNPTALTESVEHLLDTIVDDNSSDDGDNAICRLQQLNEAFGALQKCLEDNTSRTSSPRNDASATIKQRILSPTSSAPLTSANLSVRRDDSPEEF